MSSETIAVLAPLILLLAALYASVGHAGASGYLAAMALLGVAPEVMKPTALVLNVLVATIGSYQFWRAGCFRWSLFWPFAVASIPAAYVGGLAKLPDALYKPVVGGVLLFAALRLLWSPQGRAAETARPLPTVWALIVGAGIGLLSGLTGTGGGIFLSPLLLLFGWAPIRQAAGVTAPFVLVNSISGLLGLMQTAPTLPAALPYWAAAAVVGGTAGSFFGSRRLPSSSLRRLLAVVLAIAGAKLLLGV